MLIHCVGGVFVAENKLISKAQKLLLEYRPTVLRKTALETALGTACGNLIPCINQIRFTQQLTETLQSHKLLGEKLYWIIYFTYMTERQPSDIDEILSGIATKCGNIPRSSYYRLRLRAIAMLDSQLLEVANENPDYV